MVPTFIFKSIAENSKATNINLQVYNMTVIPAEIGEQRKIDVKQKIRLHTLGLNKMGL